MWFRVKLPTRLSKVAADLWHNRSRTLLVIIAIGIGVMSFGSLLITRDLMVGNVDQAYRAIHPATITMTISPFDEDLVRIVEGYREVELAQGTAAVEVKYPTGGDAFVPLTLYAWRDYGDLEINIVAPEAGAAAPARREVLLERTSLASTGLRLGDAIPIELPDGQQYMLRVAGTVHDLSVPSANRFNELSGYVSLETLQWLQGSRLYGRMDIVTGSGVTTLEQVEGVAHTLKERLERDGYSVHYVRSERPGQHWMVEVIQGMSGFLYIMGMAGLLLSAFLVWNTISSILVQQRRQIGVLRAIGGSRRQITAMYVLMVVIYGLIGFLLALPLGVLTSLGYMTTSMAWLNFDILYYTFPPVVGLAMLAAAVGTPLIASLLTIARSTRITVREALTDYGIGVGSPDDPIERLLTRLSGLPRPVMLSLRNTFRQRERLLVTLGTLAIAGAMFIGVLSFSRALNLEVGRLMQTGLENVNLSLGGTYPAATLEREALRVPGVTAAEARLTALAARVRPDGAQGSTFSLIGLPPASPFVEPRLEAGRWLQAGDTYAVVVSSALLEDEPDLTVGSEITLKIGGASRPWTVVGVYAGAWWAQSAYVPYQALAQVTRLTGAADTLAVATAGTTARAEEAAAWALEDALDRIDVEAGSWRTYHGRLSETRAQFSVLVLISMIVALFLALVGGLGLAGTISLNVMERTREIGVMRGIGASSRAVRQIIVAEGVASGLLSWLLAAALAAPLSWGLQQLVGGFTLGRAIPFAYSIPAALLWLPVVLAISALAGLAPAQRAARISVREALAYE